MPASQPPLSHVGLNHINQPRDHHQERAFHHGAGGYKTLCPVQWLADKVTDVAHQKPRLVTGYFAKPLWSAQRLHKSDQSRDYQNYAGRFLVLTMLRPHYVHALKILICHHQETEHPSRRGSLQHGKIRSLCWLRQMLGWPRR